MEAPCRFGAPSESKGQAGYSALLKKIMLNANVSVEYIEQRSLD